MRRRALAICIFVSVVLAGCGVGPESGPRALPPEAASAVAAAPPNDEAVAGRLTELWFVRDNEFAPVDRKTLTVLSPQSMIEALEAGPTVPELDNGFRTAITPVVPDVPLVTTADAAGVPVAVEPGEIAVVLADDFTSLPSQEQTFVLGQVVLTLANIPGSSVLFVNTAGTPVGVPLPNGRLSSGQVTASDYESMVAG